MRNFTAADADGGEETGDITEIQSTRTDKTGASIHEEESYIYRNAGCREEHSGDCGREAAGHEFYRRRPADPGAGAQAAPGDHRGGRAGGIPEDRKPGQCLHPGRKLRDIPGRKRGLLQGSHGAL